MAKASKLTMVGRVGLAGALLMAMALSTRADDTIKRGQALAEKLCSGCHAVGLTDVSKLDKSPPMRDLAKRWKGEQIAEALAEGITTGHKEMPEFRLNPDELDAFLAWFDDLGARAKAPTPPARKP